MSSSRDILIDRLEKDLIGPFEIKEILSEKPSNRYLLGSLSPENLKVSSEEDDSLNTHINGDVEDKSIDENTSLLKNYRPSSMGLSFCIEANSKDPTIEIFINIGSYKLVFLDENNNEVPLEENKEKNKKWKRVIKSHNLKVQLDKEIIVLKDNITKIENSQIFIKKINDKTKQNISFVTVSFINKNQIIKSDDKISTSMDEIEEMSFFQTSLKIKNIDGKFIPKKKKFVATDEDSKSSSLIYRNFQEYAAGHTCSAIWKNNNNFIEEIESSWLPKSEVKPTNPNGDEIFKTNFDNNNLNLDITNFTDNKIQRVKDIFNLVCSSYDQWIKSETNKLDFLNDEEKIQGKTHLQNCEIALNRMKEGSEIILKNKFFFESFILANKCIEKQYSWSSKDVFTWRPFQLSFFLICATSIINPQHEDRDILDLLWFPTGGGKTEAYLLISAFLLFLRRFKNLGNQNYLGLTIIMRYTLRTLTIQQFQRACKMIIAAEIIRREHDILKKQFNFSIGLWVGDSATPNKLSKAFETRDNPNIGSTPIQMDQCPCCNKKLIWKITNNSIDVSCFNKVCEINTLNNLPIMTCDELIYDNPPSLLIGTIDKFAQVTRQKRIKDLFSTNNNNNSPELIIQDELHLISGPLGTLSGLYEIAIDKICSLSKQKPKIIGSTATIRMAKEQIRGLFNRKTFQFPPPGLNADNSCFSKTDYSRKGRTYIGVTTAGRTPKYILQAVCASLLQSTNDSKIDMSNKDLYGSLLVYFNALRELGGSLVMMQDDVPKSMSEFSKRYNEKVRKITEPYELTSRKNQNQVRQIMKTLENKKLGDPECIDVLLATNMLSVGVDIDRLGLMVVNGQPKTMSEYIQSTSRVGRKYPGIVITIYNNNKNRDKSHYETFTSWHQSLYKDIEATSVTPFAPRARDKALHAIIVSIARNIYFKEFENPNLSLDKNYTKDEKINILKNDVKKIILDRVSSISETEKEDTEKEIDLLISKWSSFTEISTYWNDKNFKKSLMISAEYAAERQASGKEALYSLSTPNSMRDVEPETGFKLLDFENL